MTSAGTSGSAVRVDTDMPSSIWRRAAPDSDAHHVLDAHHVGLGQVRVLALDRSRAGRPSQ